MSCHGALFPGPWTSFSGPGLSRLQPGDRCDSTGTLKVVPGVGAINLPEAQAESSSRHKGEQTEVVKGLKSFGVRDFHYRMAFLACNVV